MSSIAIPTNCFVNAGMAHASRNSSQATEWAAKRAEAVARARELREQKAKSVVDEEYAPE